ncbi:hypothetical protein BJ508DRAFT_333745 [Ascobolus immersus RN42]|uniref:Uncharacterized protein n=1 Tax=Ascobolus immersus RN42 TaxID=1160509 RepID=A0A3N4HIQ9_ASCIM|nr:hypothetical protein BJ508DRAFT_333745 [Ascobolus immersus RN42]
MGEATDSPSLDLHLPASQAPSTIQTLVPTQPPVPPQSQTQQTSNASQQPQDTQDAEFWKTQFLAMQRQMAELQAQQLAIQQQQTQVSNASQTSASTHQTPVRPAQTPRKREVPTGDNDTQLEEEPKKKKSASGKGIVASRRAPPTPTTPTPKGKKRKQRACVDRKVLAGEIGLDPTNRKALSPVKSQMRALGKVLTPPFDFSQTYTTHTKNKDRNLDSVITHFHEELKKTFPAIKRIHVVQIVQQCCEDTRRDVALVLKWETKTGGTSQDLEKLKRSHHGVSVNELIKKVQDGEIELPSQNLFDDDDDFGAKGEEDEYDISDVDDKYEPGGDDEHVMDGASSDEKRPGKRIRPSPPERGPHPAFPPTQSAPQHHLDIQPDIIDQQSSYGLPSHMQNKYEYDDSGFTPPPERPVPVDPALLEKPQRVDRCDADGMYNDEQRKDAAARRNYERDANRRAAEKKLAEERERLLADQRRFEEERAKFFAYAGGGGQLDQGVESVAAAAAVPVGIVRVDNEAHAAHDKNTREQEEAKEKAAREQEKAAQEARDRQAEEKVAQDAKDREAEEKVAQDAKDREAEEKVAQDAKDREAKEKAAQTAIPEETAITPETPAIIPEETAITPETPAITPEETAYGEPEPKAGDDIAMAFGQDVSKCRMTLHGPVESSGDLAIRETDAHSEPKSLYLTVSLVDEYERIISLHQVPIQYFDRLSTFLGYFVACCQYSNEEQVMEYMIEVTSRDWDGIAIWKPLTDETEFNEMTTDLDDVWGRFGHKPTKLLVRVSDKNDHPAGKFDFIPASFVPVNGLLDECDGDTEHPHNTNDTSQSLSQFLDIDKLESDGYDEEEPRAHTPNIHINEPSQTLTQFVIADRAGADTHDGHVSEDDSEPHHAHAAPVFEAGGELVDEGEVKESGDRISNLRARLYRGRGRGSNRRPVGTHSIKVPPGTFIPTPAAPVAFCPTLVGNTDMDPPPPPRTAAPPIRTSMSPPPSPTATQQQGTDSKIAKSRAPAIAFGKLSEKRIKDILKARGFVLWSSRGRHTAEYKDAIQSAKDALEEHMDAKKPVDEFDASVFTYECTTLSSKAKVAPSRNDESVEKRPGLRTSSKVRRSKKASSYEDTLDELDDIKSASSSLKAGKAISKINARNEEPIVDYEEEQVDEEE